MLILNRADIAGLLDIDAVIDAVELAHRAVALGHGSEGARASVPLPGSDAVLIPMIGTVGPLQAAGLKMLTDSPSNPALGRPRQQSVVLLLDPETMAVEALLDGAELTMVRTAAASAVATRYLSRSNSSTLGLVGAGTLARTHLRAIRAVRPIERVLVWSRNPETVASFAADIADIGVEVIAVQSVKEVAAQADILCTLTPARTPILEGAWLPAGIHVNAVGAPPRHGYREIDTEVIRRSRVVIDSQHVAQAESDAIRIALDEGAVNSTQVSDELGQVIAGQVAGRSDDTQITLYNSVGLAIQDLAAARLILNIARAKGLGHEIAINAPTDQLAATHRKLEN